MLDNVGQALRKVPLDIGDDLAHVGAVVFGEATADAFDRDDVPPGLMPMDSSSPS